MGEQVSHVVRLQSLLLAVAENITGEKHSGKICTVVHREPHGTDVLQSIGVNLSYRQHLHPNQTEVKIQGSVCPWVMVPSWKNCIWPVLCQLVHYQYHFSEFLLTWRSYVLFAGPAAAAAELSSQTARRKNISSAKRTNSDHKLLM